MKPSALDTIHFIHSAFLFQLSGIAIRASLLLVFMVFLRLGGVQIESKLLCRSASLITIVIVLGLRPGPAPVAKSNQLTRQSACVAPTSICVRVTWAPLVCDGQPRRRLRVTCNDHYLTTGLRGGYLSSTKRNRGMCTISIHSKSKGERTKDVVKMTAHLSLVVPPNALSSARWL